MKHKIAFIFICFISIGYSQTVCPIIPTPTEYSESVGNFTLLTTLSCRANGSPIEVIDFLSTSLNRQHSIELEINEGLGYADIVFQQNKELIQGSYQINVGRNIIIQFSSNESCFHAVTSLLQMIQGEAGAWWIKNCNIKDSPKFQWRGLHLDVSRHFFSVQDVKRYIDIMALYKFNTFHWHLTDDQGWRIEIEKYPKLTDVGAYRDSTVIGHYSDSPRKYEVIKHGGYYTQEEVKDIVAYAAKKFVTIVPEIELPGHSRAALAAYPEFSCTGVEQEVPGLWGIFDDIYCSKESSINFMKDILSEVVELFPSEYIHIGGDEAPKTRWKDCDACQRVIRDNNLKDEHELQSYFIQQMDAFLANKGKKLIGWDEILEGGLSPNAAVMSWRGDKGGIAAARQEHFVVMSPNTHCYFDYYQSSHSIEPLAIGGYLPLEKVYAFNPIPDSLTPKEGKYILGGQANLWTEYMPDMKHVEYMAYPRALALAQGLWCNNKPSYDDFLKSYLTYQETYLRRHDVDFARSIHYPDIKIERSGDGINIRFEGPTPDSKFRVSTTNKPGRESMEAPRTMRASDSLFIQRINNNDDFGYTIKVESDAYFDAVYYDFRIGSNLGRKIELITAAHPKYEHNGSLNMVDGIHGSTPWKGSEWLGFRESEIEFIIDFDTFRDVDGLEIGFLENNGSWIYLPNSVSIYTSNDKGTWTEIVKREVNKESMTEGGFRILFNSESRYIKVIINTMDLIPEGMDGGGNIPWTFIDEVEIIEGQ
jgi:hexosaminidase